MAGAHDDHHCIWRQKYEELQSTTAVELEKQRAEIDEQQSALDDQQAKLEAVMHAMQALERRVLGPKTEKMPCVTCA